MNFGEFKNGKAQQALPPTLASREADFGQFEALCHELCIKLLRLIAFGIEVRAHISVSSMRRLTDTQIDPQNGGKDWFASRHDPSQGPSGSVLRLVSHDGISPSFAQIG